MNIFEGAQSSGVEDTSTAWEKDFRNTEEFHQEYREFEQDRILDELQGEGERCTETPDLFEDQTPDFDSGQDRRAYFSEQAELSQSSENSVDTSQSVDISQSTGQEQTR